MSLYEEINRFRKETIMFDYNKLITEWCGKSKGNVSFGKEFKKWLKKLNLSDMDVLNITMMAKNSQMLGMI